MGIATLQEDYRVVYPNDPWEAKGLLGVQAIRYVNESQKRESRRGPRMDSLNCTLGGTQELPESIRLPGAQGHGIQEALRVDGKVASLSHTQIGSHDGVDILGDNGKQFGEVGDHDVHHPTLKPGEVHLHVHPADHLLEGHSSHTSNEAPAPKGPFVDCCRQRIKSRGLQLGGMGGDGATLKGWPREPVGGGG